MLGNKKNSAINLFVKTQMYGILFVLFLFLLPLFISGHRFFQFEIKIVLLSFVRSHIYLSAVLFFGLLLLGVFLHELIHALFFMFFAKNGYKSIKIGFSKKYQVPYCTCTEAIPTNQYIITLLMPCILIGILPYGLGLFYQDILGLFWGVIFIALSLGDLMVLFSILNDYRPNALYRDSQTEIGGEYVS